LVLAEPVERRLQQQEQMPMEFAAQLEEIQHLAITFLPMVDLVDSAVI